MMKKLVLLFFAAVGSLSATQTDVLIYGATPAGISAAVTLKRLGHDVIIWEPGKFIGGMMSGGLSATDKGIHQAIGGFAREFFVKAGEVYDLPIAFEFEPHVAENIFKEYLKNYDIPTYTQHHIDYLTVTNKRIYSATATNGARVRAHYFMDASYEGDLMARSGARYTFGRESRQHYGESFAGVRDFQEENQFPEGISGVDKHGVLPGIELEPMGKPGEGDDRIQAYNYRPCITDYQDNQIPFFAPEGYDPRTYTLLLNVFEKLPRVYLNDILIFLPIGNTGKVDLNSRGPFSTDLIGGSRHYPYYSIAKRKQLAQMHKRHIQGLLYFLTTDKRVPELVRLPLRRYGYCKDEFVENYNWPYQLYIRECRRMLGEFVLTQADVTTNRYKADSIGLGSHRIESHPVQRILLPDKTVQNRGDVQNRVPLKTYQIPYRSLIPLKEDCENLIVPVCVSASHIAYSSIRMEPQYMIMAQSGATAISLAMEDYRPVQDVDIQRLQEVLIESGQQLSNF